MVIFLSLLFLFSSKFNHFIEASESDCLQFGDTCFKYYRNSLSRNDAFNFCKTVGGYLAFPQEDKIWLEIYNKLLKSQNAYTWTTFTVSANSRTFNENAEILSQSSYWSANRLSSTVTKPRCMLVSPSSPNLILSTCESTYPTLCQFSGCDMAEVKKTNPDYNICMKAAQLTSKFVPINTVLNVNCWKGFRKLPGTTQVTCISKGNWSKPNCNDGCQSPATIRQHSKMVFPLKAVYDVNEEALFICKDDYNTWQGKTLRTHYKLTCLSGGIWSNEELDCVRTEETINVYFDQNSVILKCDSKLPFWRKWMKNGEFITNKTRVNILLTGDLEIKSPNVSDEGVYYCLRERSIANVFHVSKQINCRTAALNPVYYNYENVERDFLSLTCNLLDGQFSWLKDGKPLQMDAYKSIIDKGVLLLKKMKLSDEGNYTCQCGNAITAIHTVTVYPSSKNYCGNGLNSSLVTLWHVQDSTPFCYGALIDSQWVVTSAFCLFSFRYTSQLDITIRFIGEDLKKTNALNTTEIKIHPNYQPRLQAHDIALIKLKTFVRFSSTVNPACMKKIDLSERYTCQENNTWDIKSIGFGSLDSLKNDNKVEFREQSLVIEPFKDCLKNATIVFNNDIFCASRNSGNYPGDNGSPIIININGTSHLIGLFNVGNQANGLKAVDYFTDVVQYYDWIETVTHY